MGEIKSSLDIVMEKTRHLKLTDEERQTQKLKDIQGSLKGLLQKYKDHLLKDEKMRTEWEALKHSHSLPDDSLLVIEALQQIGLDQENQPLLHLLTEVCHLNTSGLTTVFEAYEETRQEALDQFRLKAKDRLARKRSISGSAVVPNIEQDRGWADQNQKIEMAHEALLEQERQKLLNAE
ncbi:MAG: hypothetical protein V3S66_03245 [Desulfobacterales bacterium]